ncbi:MAG TPA: hypothetical protein VLM37_06940 [Fibrobacteraceae bacterium]|nr:hypothetical protein [Fibrobacteraceae bacterium]
MKGSGFFQLLLGLAVFATAGTMTLYTSSGTQYTYDLASVGKISFDSSAVDVSAVPLAKIAPVSAIGIKALGNVLMLSASSGTDLQVEIRAIDGRLVHQFQATVGNGGQASVSLAKVLGNGIYVATAVSTVGQKNHTFFQIVR